MYKPIVLCFLLLFSNCGNKEPEKSYLPKMEFKKTPNPKYDTYFPSNTNTEKNNKNTNKKNLTTEPIPSFTKDDVEDKKSEGFFNFLFKEENENKIDGQKICEELLNINKNILIEQNRKLMTLNNDNLILKEQINNLKDQINKLNRTDSNNNKALKKEINRLNKLIEILSTEIK